MSGKLSFKGVEEARESVMTEPGTKDVFNIAEVKFDSTPNKGTYYMGVKFARKQDSFNHSFFLTEKALPRVQSLAKAVGKTLDDDISEEQLKKLFEGKDVALKVVPKFDEENGRVYADLGFGGFCKPASELSKLEFTGREQEDIARAKAMRSKASTPDADGPSTKTPKPDASSKATASAADEDIF